MNNDIALLIVIVLGWVIIGLFFEQVYGILKLYRERIRKLESYH